LDKGDSSPLHLENCPLSCLRKSVPRQTKIEASRSNGDLVDQHVRTAATTSFSLAFNWQGMITVVEGASELARFDDFRHVEQADMIDGE